MIAYIFKSSLSLVILFGLYWFILRKEKLFAFNRFFLILSVVLSLVVPVISIPVNFKVTPKPENIISAFNYVMPDISSEEKIISHDVNSNPLNAGNKPSPFDISEILLALYISGVILFLMRFLRNLFMILHKVKLHEKISFEGYRIILTNDKTGPYCFFSFIFLNKEEYMNGRIDTELLNHELEHVKQSHTIDIMLIELVKTFYWFNPVHVLYDRAIRINHEYLADNGVISDNSDIKSYADKLLTFIMGSSKIPLTSGSHHSFTKQRLLMMTKSGSGSFIYGARIALTLFLVTVFLLLLSFKEANQQASELTAAEPEAAMALNIVRGMVINENDKPFAGKNSADKVYGKNKQDVNVVKGIVVNEEGTPIQGATVIISGIPSGVITDTSGHFTIGNVTEDAHLIISSDGYISKYLVPAFSSEMKVEMFLDKESSKSLLIRDSFKNGPYPLIIVDGVESDKRFNELDMNEIIKGIAFLDGKNAPRIYGEKGRNGVIIISTKKNAEELIEFKPPEMADKSSIRFRRRDGSISNTLIIIDGVVSEKQGEEGLKEINPRDILSISVLKSTDKYGEKGKDGVILITTRKNQSVNTHQVVKGVVLSENGKPLKEVTLLSAGPKEDFETKTNKAGEFTLYDWPAENPILFRREGFKSLVLNPPFSNVMTVTMFND